MNDGMIWTAILGCMGTVLGSFFGVFASSKLTSHRLLQLEKKVEKHNTLVERMTKVEERAKSNTHRIEDLERL